MKCTIRVYLNNDDFSQEYADQHNNGQESEMNRKFEWEDELAITPEVERVEVQENADYVLQGQMPNGEAFSETIGAMRKFVFYSSDGVPVAQLACSELLFESYEELRDAELEFKLFLKDREPLSNPILGIYIAARSFPKSLIFE